MRRTILLVKMRNRWGKKSGANGGIRFLLEQPVKVRNLGDQVIFRQLIGILEAHGEIFLRGAQPDYLECRKCIQGRLKTWALRIASRLRGMRIVHVSAPGAVLQAPGKPPEGRLKSILERWLNEGSIAMGMSVLPGSSQIWSRGLAWIGVRDTASIDTLVESGCTRVAYFPDLALLQEVSPSDFSGRVGNGLAFSFRRAFPESGDMDGYDDWLREALGRFIRSLPGEVRKQSVFFHQVDEDASFVAELALENSVRFKDEPLHITTYKDFYREFDLVVSNRLHCLLFGAACGAVPVALTDQRHTKLVSLFNGLGWGNLLILRNGEASETSRFREILAGGQGIRPNLASALERQRDIAQAAIPVMLDSLSGRP